jgi:hypothetical protein
LKLGRQPVATQAQIHQRHKLGEMAVLRLLRDLVLLARRDAGVDIFLGESKCLATSAAALAVGMVSRAASMAINIFLACLHRTLFSGAMTVDFTFDRGRAEGRRTSMAVHAALPRAAW